jgi:hypothetical protein
MPEKWPIYAPRNGIHTMTWEDQTRIVMQHPHLEKGEYVAFTEAYGPSGNFVGEGQLRIFDDLSVARRALRYSATNAATPVDWHARFTCMGRAVHQHLLDEAKATPPVPLRRAGEEPQPYPVKALGSILTPMVNALRGSIQAVG